MDNLTHTLTGLMLARAGLGDGVPAGSLLLILAANAPDVDVVTAAFGTHVYLDHHRGLTHALAASPFLSAVSVAVVGVWKREAFPWLRAWVGAWIVMLSHLLWDWTNIYGIRLLEPFSSEWLRLDLVSVIDPLVWALLLAGVFWPLLGKLVSQEIGSRTRYGRGSAWVVLLLLMAYVGARSVLHARAIASMEARIYDEGTPTRVAALPDLANPFYWVALIEFPRAYRIGEIYLHREFDPSAGRVWYRGQGQHQAAKIAAETAPFQAFMRFSAFPYWIVSGETSGESEGFRVEACDLRFGNPGEGRFTAAATVSQKMEVLESSFQYAPKGRLPRPR